MALADRTRRLSPSHAVFTLASLGRLTLVGCVATGAGLAAGCVEPFPGSNVQLDFSQDTPVRSGNDPDGFTPPVDTYLTLWALDNVYAVDADGNPIFDADGDPVVASSTFFEVQKFEFQPVINPSSPCFIEIGADRFPGVHVTQVAAKLRATLCEQYGQPATCFDTPTNPPNGATEDDVTDVLTVNRRMELLPSLAGVVKAVTTYSTYQYPTPASDCTISGDTLPANSCLDDASNAQRLRVCQAIWDGQPDFYEGSDKVFTLPLNGKLYGMGEGMNPINGVGLFGGAQMFVDEVVGGADALTINWQFKDYNGDGTPDYPANFLDDHDESATGYVFMSGTPYVVARGVVNAVLVNPFRATVNATVAIFTDLGDDDLHF